jgi:hypothetical protein
MTPTTFVVVAVIAGLIVIVLLAMWLLERRQARSVPRSGSSSDSGPLDTPTLSENSVGTAK